MRKGALRAAIEADELRSEHFGDGQLLVLRSTVSPGVTEIGRVRPSLMADLDDALRLHLAL